MEKINVRSSSNTEDAPHQLRAITFDLDLASSNSLREALPEWEIEEISAATAGSLTYDWNGGAAGLLVIQARQEVAETLELCAGLRRQVGRMHTPLLVLVQPAQEALVTAALKAGAHSCLVLPIHAKDVTSMLARVHEGNQPGRHTLNLDKAQREDRWRDDGGQG